MVSSVLLFSFENHGLSFFLIHAENEDKMLKIDTSSNCRIINDTDDLNQRSLYKKYLK